MVLNCITAPATPRGRAYDGWQSRDHGSGDENAVRCGGRRGPSRVDQASLNNIPCVGAQHIVGRVQRVRRLHRARSAAPSAGDPGAGGAAAQSHKRTRATEEDTEETARQTGDGTSRRTTKDPRPRGQECADTDRGARAQECAAQEKGAEARRALGTRTTVSAEADCLQDARERTEEGGGAIGAQWVLARMSAGAGTVAPQADHRPW